MQAVQQGSHSTAPVILINYNLPPAIQYQCRNILLSHIIPGPQEPKNLNSFLHPLVTEMAELGAGIKAYNGKEKQPFDLKAWLVLVGGNA